MSSSTPSRRTADQPDVEPQGNTLRARLARAVRRPKKADRIDWSSPPPGFMASPALAPTAFVPIEEGIRIEGDRLLGIAVAEFRRRWQPNPELRDDAGHAIEGKRLRKALQIEALGAISSPDLIETIGWRYVGEKAVRGSDRVAAVSTDGSDAGLFHLGRSLDPACATWRAAVEAAQEPWERRDRFIQERGGRTLDNLKAAEALPGVGAATDADEAAFSAVTAICDVIWKLSARTPAGLAVKARAALVDIWANSDFEADAVKGEDEDLSNQSARRLIEACCALAGVDWRGEPIPAAMAAPDEPVQGPAGGPAALVAEIMQAWAIHAAADPNGDASGCEAALERRDVLLDAAEALPATREAVGAKALVLAWIEYVHLWTRGQPRSAYSTDGRLALDINAAVSGVQRQEG